MFEKEISNQESPPESIHSEFKGQPSEFLNCLGYVFLSREISGIHLQPASQRIQVDLRRAELIVNMRLAALAQQYVPRFLMRPMRKESHFGMLWTWEIAQKGKVSKSG